VTGQGARLLELGADIHRQAGVTGVGYLIEFAADEYRKTQAQRRQLIHESLDKIQGNAVVGADGDKMGVGVARTYGEGPRIDADAAVDQCDTKIIEQALSSEKASGLSRISPVPLGVCARRCAG